jgi:hypothetical protein
MAKIDLKEMVKAEYLKCLSDPIYTYKKYTKIQHPIRGKILFDLFPFQEAALADFDKYRFNIVNKSRQMGISTLVAAHAIYKMCTQDDFKVLVIATNQLTAKNLVTKVQIMHEFFPSWFKKPAVENNKLGMKLSNGSEIKALSSSTTSGRSEAVSLLIIDEAAHIDNIDSIWGASQLTLATGGSAILLSTPNGQGNLFHKIFSRAISGKGESGLGNFNPINLPWDLHPERDQNWRDEQTELLGERLAAQECDCSFVTSGHTLIAGEILEWYSKNVCKDPIEKRGIGSDFWIWKYPDYGTAYLISADVARGDGSDYSTFQILDIAKNEQVGEFEGKIGTREFGRMLVAVGTEWNNALLVIDNKNIGWDTVQEVIDLQYPNLYYSYKTDPYFDENIHIRKNYDLKNKEDKVPGFTTTPVVRPIMMDKIEMLYRSKEALRYSKRLLEQYKVFIWINGKPQAQNGYSDDLIMADAMGVFMRDTAIKMNHMGIELTKKALNHIGKSIYTPKSIGNNEWNIKVGNETENLKWLL